MGTRMNSKQRAKARKKLLKRGNNCHYCGCELRKEIRTIDHVVPLSAGGSNRRHNLVLACRTCNETKADRLLTIKQE